MFLTTEVCDWPHMWRDFILNWQNFFQGLHFIFYFIYVNVFPQTALVFYHIAHFPYSNVWLSLTSWIEQCFFFVLLFGRGVTHISNSFEMEIRSLNCAKQQKNECNICSMFCSGNNVPLALREFLFLKSYQEVKLINRILLAIILISCR